MENKLFTSFILTLTIILLYNFLDNSKNSICERCLYTSCPSNYISSWCINNYKENENMFFLFIKEKTKNESNHLLKTIEYSQLYGSFMERCIKINRHYCTNEYCTLNCNNSNIKPIYSSLISLLQDPRLNLAISKYNKTQNFTKSYISYLSKVDNCIINSLEIKNMHTQCSFSVFKEDCTNEFYNKAKKQCT